ncbi:MmyB family transcriptional regulator [Streptomyces justiciae]|uniref:MmyB family transcriptional regulator n=1 Tax=Streptomyces justiciae TaxID=2780140 RepID=UPI00390891AA
MRTLYADWEAAAQSCVAQLRMEAARCPEDPRLAKLVGELSTRDAQFAKWWADHRVAARTVGTKILDHPVVGELVLDWDTLTAHTDPDQHLTVWTAALGSPTHERLRILDSWAAEQEAAGFFVPGLTCVQPAHGGATRGGWVAVGPRT